MSWKRIPLLCHFIPQQKHWQLALALATGETNFHYFRDNYQFLAKNVAMYAFFLGKIKKLGIILV